MRGGRTVGYRVEGTEERARDLQRTANTFDGTRLLHDDVAHVLASFAQAGEKLRLLHEKGLTAQNEALLERHFIVPSAASGVDSSLMPHLLSSRLDKEQEDEEAMLQRDAESCGSMHGHWSEERHNEAVKQAIALFEQARSLPEVLRPSHQRAAALSLRPASEAVLSEAVRRVLARTDLTHLLRVLALAAAIDLPYSLRVAALTLPCYACVH